MANPAGDNNVLFGDLEDACTCWVCFEAFKLPITLHCGHSFCQVRLTNLPTNFIFYYY